MGKTSRSHAARRARSSLIENPDPPRSSAPRHAYRILLERNHPLPARPLRPNNSFFGPPSAHRLSNVVADCFIRSLFRVRSFNGMLDFPGSDHEMVINVHTEVYNVSRWFTLYPALLTIRLGGTRWLLRRCSLPFPPSRGEMSGSSDRQHPLYYPCCLEGHRRA